VASSPRRGSLGARRTQETGLSSRPTCSSCGQQSPRSSRRINLEVSRPVETIDGTRMHSEGRGFCCSVPCAIRWLEKLDQA